ARASKRSSCRQRGEGCRRGLLQRPVDVLANERARLFATRRQRSDDGGVAERDRDVALPALEADAADRAALGLAQEVVLAPSPELEQLRRIERRADVEIGDRARARELVPRADELAVVATV